MLNQKRGKNVAVAGAAFQLVITFVMLAIWLWTGSLAAMSCTLLLAGGVPLWLAASVLFYCRLLARREERELEELAAAGRGGSVFEGEQAGQVRPAAARIAWMDRWVAPAFTLLWAAYHAAVGILMLRYLAGRQAAQLANTLEGILFVVVIGLVSFLFGRYAVGMSTLPDWRLLRATGSYLLVNALFIAAATASLVAGHYQIAGVDLVVAYVVPVVQVLLAVELLLNFILDIYRPRVPGREQRPSFDSRFFNLIAEPAKLGHSIAEALNYQFGFEVSKTWFYQLLQRAFVPLILAGAAVLLAMSSIVVVNEGEIYVIEHWNKRDDDRGELGPGVHLKYPWPIETARRFEKRTKQLWLGAEGERSEEERKASLIKGREVFLWMEEHGELQEKNFLVALPTKFGGTGQADTKKQAVSTVNVVRLVLTLDYRIKSPSAYGYGVADPGKLLEFIARREIVHQCANATLTELVPGRGEGQPEAIMTIGRQAFAGTLRDAVAKRAENLGLGVEIVRIGVIEVHPPKETAGDYLALAKAERQRDQYRYEAQADANRELASVAGDPYKALDLAMAIEARDQLNSLRDLGAASREFSGKLNGYVAQTEKNLALLNIQIGGEPMLDQRKGEKGEAVEGLRRRYQHHLAVLETIRGNPQAVQQAAAEAEKDAGDAFATLASGRPVSAQAQANINRWKMELQDRAEKAIFQERLSAFVANKPLYFEDLWLKAWEEYLGKTAEKTIVGINPGRISILMGSETEAGPVLDLGMPSSGR